MKKVLLFLTVAILLPLVGLRAEEVKTISLTYEKSDFIFRELLSHTTSVYSKIFPCGYSDDLNEPGLPWFPVDVKISNEKSFDRLSVSYEKQLLFDDVTVSANTESVPTNSDTVIPQSVFPVYKKAMYPDKNVRFIECTDVDGTQIVRLLVCPFEFDAANKTLSLVQKFSINLYLKDLPSPLLANLHYGNGNMADILNDCVDAMPTDNGIACQSFTFDDVNSKISTYAIITSSELADMFKSLAEWKTKKGIKTTVYTVEEILKENPFGDVPLSIKRFIENLYVNDNLEYVLLGGDDTVVPVRGCYGHAGGHEDNNIPTDLYYACMGEEFEWDANGNGIYGEEDDDINMSPSIFVSRAPVRTPSDVESFCSKIIQYEQANNTKQWHNNMLIAGMKLLKYESSGESDGAKRGNILYYNTVKPLWKGTVKRFFDTFTDFSGGANYELSSTSFQSQLENGYDFVDIITHGHPTALKMEKDLYTVSNSEALQNPNFTIITTNACETNAFDSYRNWEGKLNDPCLSESFIRQKESGVVAYLGSSRYGWATWDSLKLGESMEYDTEYYRQLFSPKPVNKNFGRIVAAAKKSFIGLCSANEKTRWLQFALNPVGDPEMPIFTTIPKEFSGIRYSKSADGTNLSVGTQVDSCRICVMSSADNGKSYYAVKNNVKSATFHGVKMDVTVCFTKQNYKPLVTEIKKSLSNKIQSCSINSDGDAAICVDLSDCSNANIVVTPLNGEKRTEVKLNQNVNNISVDKSKLNKGVNVITLYVDGNKVDSKTINI